ncbi:thioredoxin-disulfide reductase [Sphingobium sp. 22B]|uniref:thioredoxin-disulfide reductase n=1 Tax=unclassified Sphingobium TaxID=2611147 RepID=UPI00078565BD|nr:MULTISPECIES: thioredoxin-disulfide reductase [unclassified Sphingobium]KXU31621.1 thioredoxin-disulfide reductase [Sphingobium sp. AM]KYC32954.1 thioredoxin-disulfide reductase [Sphingobium sp. 22B]OAP30568.1 thioredoxin-disulfide reductase [Sphingobium sp. 20006FA]
MPRDRHSKVLIIGSGPAGYTAAVYAARAALKPLLIEGMQPGGQLTITTDVENWPGDRSVLGPDLMARMAAQVAHVGTEVVSDTIVEVDLAATPFVAVGDSGARYTGDTVVIATGASARWLGLDSETRYRGAGVSACATCDGFFYRDRVVAVVGGGNTAVEEALYLTNFAEKVYLIHRRGELRADRTNQARLHANPKIEMVWHAEVAEVRGDGRVVTGVELRDVRNGQARALAVDGLFVAIGHDPATSLFAGQIAMDAEGYILVTPGSTATSVPGIFAAGDVQDKLFRQAVTSAGMGCMAALEAERYLAGHMPHAIAAEPGARVTV